MQKFKGPLPDDKNVIDISVLRHCVAQIFAEDIIGEETMLPPPQVWAGIGRGTRVF